MKKIILSFEGTMFPQAAFEFALRLNKLQPVFLAGVFLPQNTIANLWSYAEAGSSERFIPLVEAEESAMIQQHTEQFKKLCHENGIEHSVHNDFYEMSITELERESLYADLLIMGSPVLYDDKQLMKPALDIEFTLRKVKCPVIIVPANFAFPESLILAYDGSDNAVFAIKQFAYLFPELTRLNTLLVYAGDQEDIPERKLIEELATRHFSDLTLAKLDIDPKRYFSSWIMGKKSSLLVSGAYGKRGLRGLFKKHFVREVITDHQLPVFVAHR